MLLHGQVIPSVEEVVGKEGFLDPRHQKLARELMTFWENEKKMDAQAFLNQTGDEELKNLASELLLAEESLVDADRTLRDCLRQVKLSRLRQEIQQVDEEIRQRSRQGKEDSAGPSGLRELLKRKQRLMTEQKKWSGYSAGWIQPEAAQ
jgi:replicative DNA helicase